jgi:DNA invertase Pin-like site-specific DNA recombinase
VVEREAGERAKDGGMARTEAERRVDLVSLKDGFSLDSLAGRLHARILSSVAEYETESRAERVDAGQQVARRKGKTWGGSDKAGDGS